MKHTLRIYMLIALCDVFAAEAQMPREWSLEQCINYAKEHNLDLKQLEHERETREIELNSAKNNYLPTLNAGANQNFDFGRSPSKTGVIVDQNSANTSAYLQLNVSIFDGFMTKNTVASKKFALQAATASLQAAQENLSINIASYYLQVLYYKEMLSVAKMNISYTDELKKHTQILVDEGKIPASQLYDVEAQLAAEEVMLTDAENNVSLALLELGQYLELDASLQDGFDIAAPEIDNAVNKYINSLVLPDCIYEKAICENPRIKEQQFLLTSRKKAMKSIIAKYYPTLSFSASYSNGYYHYYNNITNIPIGDQLNQNERKTIGFTLTVPIFDRFQVRNSIRASRIAIKNNYIKIEEAKRTLYKEIQQAYSNAIASRNKYESSCKSVKAAKEAYGYAKERYDAGKSTVFEYNEAKKKYTNSLSEQAQAKYNFVFKAKILDFYNGLQLRL